MKFNQIKNQRPTFSLRFNRLKIPKSRFKALEVLFKPNRTENIHMLKFDKK